MKPRKLIMTVAETHEDYIAGGWSDLYTYEEYRERLRECGVTVTEEGEGKC